MVFTKVTDPLDDPLGLMAAWGDPLAQPEEELLSPEVITPPSPQGLDWFNLSELTVSPEVLLEDLRRDFYRTTAGSEMPIILPEEVSKYYYLFSD